MKKCIRRFLLDVIKNGVAQEIPLTTAPGRLGVVYEITDKESFTIRCYNKYYGLDRATLHTMVVRNITPKCKSYKLQSKDFTFIIA